VLLARHSIPPKAETGRRLLKVPRVQNWLPTRGISGHHLTIERSMMPNYFDIILIGSSAAQMMHNSLAPV